MTAISNQLAKLDALADVLAYPRGAFPGHVRRAVALVGEAHADAAALLREFADATVEPLTPEDREELFTRTFDVNPVCSLEVGWHLFGENYDRGDFLVKMRGLLRRCGIEESTELPDHITHVLPVLARLPDTEARALARDCALPAALKMFQGMRETDSPYTKVLAAIVTVLRETFGPPSPARDVPHVGSSTAAQPASTKEGQQP